MTSAAEGARPCIQQPKLYATTLSISSRLKKLQNIFLQQSSLTHLLSPVYVSKSACARAHGRVCAFEHLITLHGSSGRRQSDRPQLRPFACLNRTDHGGMRYLQQRRPLASSPCALCQPSSAQARSAWTSPAKANPAKARPAQRSQGPPSRGQPSPAQI